MIIKNQTEYMKAKREYFGQAFAGDEDDLNELEEAITDYEKATMGMDYNTFLQNLR